MNLSNLEDDDTARTCPEAAEQRARFLAGQDVKVVLELCVGPSLRTLKEAYDRYGIAVVGNDIDPRWQRYYPQGTWLIQDALTVRLEAWADAVVFAPPLSVGCSGRREDSLRISQIQPSYVDFLRHWHAAGTSGPRMATLVLPARVKATRQDRTEFHHLFSTAWDKAKMVSMRDAVAGRRQIRKYVEMTLWR